MLTRYTSRVTRTFAVLLTCLLLGVTMLAASQISEHSSAVVAVAVDENWRGHYDLLVTAEGGLSEAAKETDGLIEQNFSTLRADENISAQQLNAVAAMPEVEVSAPLAFVGQFVNPSYSVPVGVEVEEDWFTSEFFSMPRAFEGTIRTYFHDSQGKHLLAEHPQGHFMVTGADDRPFNLEWIDEAGDGASATIRRPEPNMQVVDVPASAQCECLSLVPRNIIAEDNTAEDAHLLTSGGSTVGAWVSAPPDLQAWSTPSSGSVSMYTTYEVVPELHSNMVAVDPVAERALLGDEGDFLEGLIEFEQLQDALGAGPCEGSIGDERAPGECLADLVDPDRYQEIHAEVFNGNPDFSSAETADELGNVIGEPGGPIIPIIYSETEYPEMTAEASFPQLAAFEDLSFAEASSYKFYRETLQDQRSEDPKIQEVHLSEQLVPFVYQGFDVAFGLDNWSPPAVSGFADDTAGTSPSLPGRPERSKPTPEQQATAPDGVHTALVNQPQGRYFYDARMTSSEQRYRPWAPNYDMRTPTGVLMAPVGSYRPGLEGASDLASYVPLGMYADAEAEVVPSDGSPGGPLPPSFSGRGALLSSPGVITTMRGFEHYRGHIEADVLRVRIAEVDGYSAENMTQIETVAEKIRGLGLDVQVVAGSSLAPVAIYLPEFHEDDSDLGWIVEEWTSLGAAGQVEGAQMAASWLLLVAAVAGVTILTCAVQLAGVKPRRREAAMLVTLGWTRDRVRRWFLAEDAPALLVVAAAAGAAVFFSSSSVAQFGALLAALAFSASVLVAAAAAASAASTSRKQSQGSAQPAKRPGDIGRRLAWSSLSAVAMTALGLLVLTCAAVTFTLVILTARAEAGVTRIAHLVNAEVLLPQTVLAAGAVTAGIMMLTMAIRQTLRQARRQHEMLLATGWPLAAITSAIRAQLLSSLAPGILLALLSGVLAVVFPGGQDPLPLVLVTFGVPVVAVAITLIWAQSYTRALAR